MSHEWPADIYARLTARDIPAEREACARYARMCRELEEYKRLVQVAQRVLTDVQRVSTQPVNEIVAALVAASLHRNVAWIEKREVEKQLNQLRYERNLWETT